jgi:hypothetical protein
MAWSAALLQVRGRGGRSKIALAWAKDSGAMGHQARGNLKYEAGRPGCLPGVSGG